MSVPSTTVKDMQKYPSLPSFKSSFYVYLIFTASGAAALIYQVIWARWLGLVFGNTATSISIVLGSFMLGLALGSWISGRYLPKINNPMKVYAWLEVAIGIFALLFPFFTSLADLLYGTVVTADSPQPFSLSVRAVLSFVLLAIPTTCMGATLPLLTDFFRRSPRHSNHWRVGLLYAANTLGAALGSLAASFFLIELLGVRSTTLVAAGLNFVVAYIGLRYAQSVVLSPATLPAAATVPLDKQGKLALVILALGGGIALASEVLWTRTLELLIGNSSYAFATILIVYLLGIATGSWLMAWVVTRLRALLSWLAVLQISMAVWTLAAVFLFNVLGEYLYPYQQQQFPASAVLWHYFLAACILLPLSLISGAVFPLATRIMNPHAQDAAGKLIAQAYAWNTVGAVVGSLLAGFVIAVLFDYIHAIYVLAICYALSTLLIMFYLPATSGKARYVKALTAILGVMALGMIVFSTLQMRGEDSFVKHQNNNPRFNQALEIVYHEPGLQGVTTVFKIRGKKTADILVINGQGMTVKITDTKMMAHLPLLAHPDPQDTLVICFGMGTTYRSAISHGGNVTVVELVSEVLKAFDYFHLDTEQVRNYPKGRMLVNDGRNFLSLSKEKFDVITVDPPPPIDAAGVTNLYSKEFIEMARNKLKPGGIMAHWVPLPGKSAGIHDMATVNMLLSTIADVFPYTKILQGWKGMGIHILASMQPIDLSPQKLARKLAVKAVSDDINEWGEVPAGYYAKMTDWRPAQTGHQILLTDDRPHLEFDLIRFWLSDVQKMHPALGW